MDSLLQAIADAPDDDGPRLVWADREGGERGELVVLQCQIAARAGTRADRVRMQARVRELLPRFQAKGETFARGFVEKRRLVVGELAPAIFERAPLLRDLELEGYLGYIGPNIDDGTTPQQAFDDAATAHAAAFAQLPPGRIRSLEVNADIRQVGDYIVPDDDHPFGDAFVALLAATPTLVGLRELKVIGGDLTAASIPDLVRLGISGLRGGTTFDGAACVALLRAAVALTHLGAWNGKPRLRGERLAPLLASREVLALRELDLWANELGEGDLLRIAELPFANLEKLGIGMSIFTRAGLDALAASAHLAALVDLNLYTTQVPPPSLARFCRAPFALRSLRVESVDHTMIGDLVAAPALEDLRVDRIAPDQLAQLRAAIPRVNDPYG